MRERLPAFRDMCPPNGAAGKLRYEGCGEKLQFSIYGLLFFIYYLLSYENIKRADKGTDR